MISLFINHKLCYIGSIYSCHLYSSIVPSIHFVPFNSSYSKRNWAKFGVGVKLIVILRHIVAYFSINIRWHSQNVSSDSRKWLIKHLFPPSSCKKQINKQNSCLVAVRFRSGIRYACVQTFFAGSVYTQWANHTISLCLFWSVTAH